MLPTGTQLSMIVVKDQINRGDGDRFVELIEAVPNAVVLFESPGGSLIDGLIIGQAINEAGFNTGVAPETACASACALAWLGGRVRYMDPSALVGFHAAYIEADGGLVQSGVGNALVGAYLNDLGLGVDAIVFITSARPEGMNWLNVATARQAGIDVVLLEANGSEVRLGPLAALKLPSGFRWIVMESSHSPEKLRTADDADQIVRTRNGYFASVIGPFEATVAERLKHTLSFVPEDAYLSSGNGFLFSLPK